MYRTGILGGTIPSSDDISLWRYMNFEKFEDLIKTQCLYFASLSQFDDKFEGSTPRLTHRPLEVLKRLRQTHASTRRLTGTSSIERIQYARQITAALEVSSRRGMQSLLSEIYVNCWHANEYESDAMWKLYSDRGPSVAIQTCFRKLRSELTENVDLGEVKYIDYDSAVFGDGTFERFWHKRKSFEHEKEIRALIWKPKIDGTMMHKGKGIVVKVDLARLINAVRTNPFSNQDLANRVTELTRNQGFEFEVQISKLSIEPIF